MPVTSKGIDCGSSISPQGWRELADSIGLSRREVAVVQGVLADLHDGKIAATLGLSQHTVHTYLKRIRAKLGVSSRVRLVERILAENWALIARRSPPPKTSPEWATKRRLSPRRGD